MFIIPIALLTDLGKARGWYEYSASRSESLTPALTSNTSFINMEDVDAQLSRTAILVQQFQKQLMQPFIPAFVTASGSMMGAGSPSAILPLPKKSCQCQVHVTPCAGNSRRPVTRGMRPNHCGHGRGQPRRSFRPAAREQNPARFPPAGPRRSPSPLAGRGPATGNEPTGSPAAQDMAPTPPAAAQQNLRPFGGAETIEPRRTLQVSLARSQRR
jgi:hypothetical protein